MRIKKALCCFFLAFAFFAFFSSLTARKTNKNYVGIFLADADRIVHTNIVYGIWPSLTTFVYRSRTQRKPSVAR